MIGDGRKLAALNDYLRAYSQAVLARQKLATAKRNAAHYGATSDDFARVKRLLDPERRLP